MHAIGFGMGIGIDGQQGGLAPYLGNIATRAYLNRGTAFNAGLTGVSTRMAHWLRDSVSSIRLGYANWYFNAGAGTEAAIGDTLQIRAALETAGGALTQVTFGGAAQGSVASGGLLLSDPIDWAGARDEKFYTRTQQLNAAGCCYLDTGNSAIGDRLDFDPSDHTMSGTIADVLSGFTYGPALILATTRRRTVLLLGTSRTHGFADTADAAGDMGCLARSVGPTNGYCNGGSPSHTASDFAAAHAKSLALAPYFSDVVIEFGANDSSGTNASLQAIYDTFAASGRRLWGATVDPITTGTWASGDGSDQTAVLDVATPNSFIRGKPAPLFGVFDIAPPVALAGNPAKWHAGYTGDGVHANQTGNLARKAAMEASIQAALA
jgi:hypothetical protein